MKDYRVMVTVKNNKLLSAIEDAGFSSVSEFSRAFSINESEVGRLLNIKKSPLKPSGELTVTAAKIIDALNCGIEDVFSEDQIWQPVEDNKGMLYVDRFDINEIMGLGETNSLESEYERSALTGYVKNLMSSSKLTQKEQRVIKMRFGLSGGDSNHLDDIAKQLDVTTERVRQIEARALRRMRQQNPEENILRGYK